MIGGWVMWFSGRLGSLVWIGGSGVCVGGGGVVI